jgi:hypothetical protein
MLHNSKQRNSAHSSAAYLQCIRWSPEAGVHLSSSPANNTEGEIHRQLHTTPRQQMTCQGTCHLMCRRACSDIPATFLVHCADCAPSAQSECLVQGARISTDNTYCISKRHPLAAVCYNSPNKPIRPTKHTQGQQALRHSHHTACHYSLQQLAVSKSPDTLTTWATADYHYHPPHRQQQQEHAG